jgi:hypothetical protein
MNNFCACLEQGQGIDVVMVVVVALNTTKEFPKTAFVLRVIID